MDYLSRNEGSLKEVLVQELIPIIGMVLTLGPLALFAASYTPIGRALTARLNGGDKHALKDELRRELLEEQTIQLEELHERLDFMERLLTEARHEIPDEKRAATPV